MNEPKLIQGGMGVAVSNWRLARAVSAEGHLGVVSGTMIETVLARRLQDGDPGGHMRRALAAFPDQKAAERIQNKYFVPGGKPADMPYRGVPMQKVEMDRELVELIIVANFVEVYLAKEGQSGIVGVNFLEKIQLPTLPSLYGAMLAGVDYVLMGAGIPKAIPAILDALARREDVSLAIRVDECNASKAPPVESKFSPAEFPALDSVPLKRPKFLAIISSNSLANLLAKKSSGKVDGFVVENYLAGGHNAPPRGPMKLDQANEPIYGARDEVNLEAIQKLGLPFWLAGAYGNEGMLADALKQGAAGIQVGTPFAFCEESGFADDVKKAVLEQAFSNQLEVYTDISASASGYPFKTLNMSDSVGVKGEYEARPRTCDLGYLRTIFRKEDGSIGYRCPGESEAAYLAKGGEACDMKGRKCLCNGLLAAVDYAQVQKDGYVEKPLVTAGKTIDAIKRFIKPGESSYSAHDVVRIIMGQVSKPHYSF